jgi:hypothetical protein
MRYPYGCACRQPSSRTPKKGKGLPCIFRRCRGSAPLRPSWCSAATRGGSNASARCAAIPSGTATSKPSSMPRSMRHWPCRPSFSPRSPPGLAAARSAFCATRWRRSRGNWDCRTGCFRWRGFASAIRLARDGRARRRTLCGLCAIARFFLRRGLNHQAMIEAAGTAKAARNLFLRSYPLVRTT